MSKCKFCGADMVTNTKTGKVFCSEKFWLKKEGNSNLDTRAISESLGRIEGILEEIHEKLFEDCDD